MNRKSNAKVNIPVTIFGNKSVPFKRDFSALFRYKNGDICWVATDFFTHIQRGQKKDSSIEIDISPIQHIIDFMSDLKPDDPSFQFLGASDKMFLDLRSWLQKNTNLNNTSINKRLRTLIEILFFIQEEYEIENTLIAKEGSQVYNPQVIVTEKRTTNGTTYYHHHSMLRANNYATRSPITTKAIEEISKIIDNHAKIQSKQANYNSQVLRLSTDILEATGIRAGELARMEGSTLELLEKQLRESDKTLGDLLNQPDCIINEYFDDPSIIKDLLQTISTYIDGDREVIWLLVTTNKSTSNAGTPRLLPIGRPLAEDIVDFYEDYVIEMIDLDDKSRKKINRSTCGYIIPKFDGKPFFNEKNASTKDKDGDGKLFSAFYSNKIGRVANEKASPHLFRHRYITNIVVKMMENLASWDHKSFEFILHRVARLSGHANIESLWTYIDSAKIVIQNKKLVTNRQLTSKLDAIFEKYNQDPNSSFAKEIRTLIIA